MEPFESRKLESRDKVNLAVIIKMTATFFHINPLEDKISNTAVSIQPNLFWFKWVRLYSDGNSTV